MSLLLFSPTLRPWTEYDRLTDSSLTKNALDQEVEMKDAYNPTKRPWNAVRGGAAGDTATV